MRLLLLLSVLLSALTGVVAPARAPASAVAASMTATAPAAATRVAGRRLANIPAAASAWPTDGHVVLPLDAARPMARAIWKDRRRE